MQLIIDIKNDSIAEKIIKILEVFQSDGIEIKIVANSDTKKKEQEYDVDYENSFQYKLDRAAFIEMKEKL